MSGLWGPVMFGGALLLIFTGYPVAFALAGTAMLFAVIGSIAGVFDPILFMAMPERTFGTMSNFTAPCRALLHLHGHHAGEVAPGRGPPGVPSACCSAPCAVALALAVVSWSGRLLAAATGVVGASVTWRWA